MRILFLTDNFVPETNAPATRTFEHARYWTRLGHEVTVITGQPNFPSGKVFPGYRNRLRSVETIEGIKVVRVWTYITANAGVVRRSLDYASFMVSSLVASVFEKRPDVIVGTSPQFFTAIAAYVSSRIRKCPFVFELRDLWPDSIVAVGAMNESGVIRLLRLIEYFLYRRAAKIVSVTNSFKRILTNNGIDATKIAVIPNGADIPSYAPADRPAELERRFGLVGKFVAAYVGTVGMAHGLGTLLDAAEHLKDRKDIAFVVVGEGAERNDLQLHAAKKLLNNVVFVGPVSKAEVKEYWQLSDVALVLLRDSPLFDYVIPSKMFEAMAMSRAIILGVRGESRVIVEEAGAGLSIQPENGYELAKAIEKMADDPAARRQMGISGRAHVAEHYKRSALAVEMAKVLLDAASDT